MRKYLLFTFLFCLFVSFVNKLTAQSCAVSNVTISNIATSTNSLGQCEVIFDLGYRFSYNNGTKFTGVFIYQPVNSTSTLQSLGAYGNISNPNKFPNASEINAFGASSPNANILSVFQVDFDTTANTLKKFRNGNNTTTSPAVFQPGLTYIRTSLGTNVDSFQFIGIKVTIPNCNQTVTLKADVVGTNDENFANTQCAPQTASFVPNAPVLRGAIQCNNPRTFTFSANILTESTVTFTARDASGAVLVPPTVPFIYTGRGAPEGGIKITSYQNIILTSPAGSNESFGPFPYASGTISSMDDIKLDVKIGGLPNANTLTIDNTCITALPVKLTYFEAKRNKEKVSLTWETAMEIKNSGFDIQRKVGNEEWKSIAFMFSQANDGNSNSVLKYTYTDNYTNKGMSQYRLRQVDTDKRSTFSEVRSVRGEEQAGQTRMYPNPSFDGKVNLVFDEQNRTRTISISDMTGRIVKQYRNVMTNSLQVELLQDGIYTIHITDQASVETTVEKLIIKKR